MQRILVIGPGGAGKSTLAAIVAARFELPLVHLDALHWKPGWIRPHPLEWQALVGHVVQRPRWVIDGNYAGTLDVRLAHCDVVIFLDMPRMLCLWRVCWRWMRHRARNRAEVAPGYPHRVTFEFLAWIWTYRSRRRPDILRRLGRLRPDQRVVVLSSRAQVRRFLAEVGVARNVGVEEALPGTGPMASR